MKDLTDAASKVAAVVTEEMVEAGFRLLEESGMAEEYLEADKLLLAEIYQTMFALRPEASDRDSLAG